MASATRRYRVRLDPEGPHSGGASSSSACISVQHTNLIPLDDEKEEEAAAAGGGGAVGGPLPRGVAWVPGGTPGEQFEAQQRATAAAAAEAIAQVQRACTERRGRFIDRDFPHTPRSLYLDGQGWRVGAGNQHRP